MQVTSYAQIFFKILHPLAFEDPYIEELSTICVVLHLKCFVNYNFKGQQQPCMSKYMQRSKHHWAALQQKLRVGPGKQAILGTQKSACF